MAKRVPITAQLLDFGDGLMLIDCPVWWRNFVKSTDGPVFDTNGNQAGPVRVRKALAENGGCFFGKDRQDNALKLITDSDRRKYKIAGVVFDNKEDALAFLLKWS